MIQGIDLRLSYSTSVLLLTFCFTCYSVVLHLTSLFWNVFRRKWASDLHSFRWKFSFLPAGISPSLFDRISVILLIDLQRVSSKLVLPCVNDRSLRSCLSCCGGTYKLKHLCRRIPWRFIVLNNKFNLTLFVNNWG